MCLRQLKIRKNKKNSQAKQIKKKDYFAPD